MTRERINWHGETIELGKLIRHYKQCSRWWSASAPFWRTLIRSAIAQARKQRAEAAERIAA